MVFKEIVPSENTFTGFLAEEWKFATKINTVNYAKLVSFNFGDFCARYKAFTYKESLASID